MKHKKIVSENIKERVCPVCGKNFVPAALHIYKVKYNQLVCSYNCRCKYEKSEELKKAKKYRTMGQL